MKRTHGIDTIGPWGWAVVIAIVVAFACLAIPGCSRVQPVPSARLGPPAEMWDRCPMVCAAQAALFLGVLSPSPDGPHICACAKPPAVQVPQSWKGDPT